MKTTIYIIMTLLLAIAGCGVSDGSMDTTNNANDVNNTSGWNSSNNVNSANNTSSWIDGDENNQNNEDNQNNVNNTGSTGDPTPEELRELLCSDATSVATTFYMSADDSGSQAQPVYSRHLLESGRSNFFYNPPREYEYLNYYTFRYDPAPTGQLVIRPELAYDAVKGEYNLLVGVVSHQVSFAQRRPFNFTFSVDCSGSMTGDAMANVKRTLRAIAGSLREGDVVSMVTWDTSQSYPLEGHVISGPNDQTFLDVIDALGPGGSTNLNAGLVAAYALAHQHYMVEGVNRVFLMSDGGANVGTTDASLIAANTQLEEGDGIFMIGVGTATSYYYHDLMDTVTDVGKGAYVYIPDQAEAEKMFSTDRILSNVEVAALDVRLQVTFPPLFVISEFHGEEISQVPDEVKQQHLAPNDAMLYHSNLLYCAEDTGDEEATFTFRVTWTDPVTRAPMSADLEASLSELLGGETAHLEKANLLVEYARVISNADALDQASWEEARLGLMARMDAYSALIEDADIVEVRDLLDQVSYY